MPNASISNTPSCELTTPLSNVPLASETACGKQAEQAEREQEYLPKAMAESLKIAAQWFTTHLPPLNRDAEDKIWQDIVEIKDGLHKLVRTIRDGEWGPIIYMDSKETIQHPLPSSKSAVKKRKEPTGQLSHPIVHLKNRMHTLHEGGEKMEGMSRQQVNKEVHPCLSHHIRRKKRYKYALHCTSFLLQT